MWQNSGWLDFVPWQLDIPALFALVLLFMCVSEETWFTWPFNIHNSLIPFLNEMIDAGITTCDNFLLISTMRSTWWCNLGHSTGVLVALYTGILTPSSTNNYDGSLSYFSSTASCILFSKCSDRQQSITAWEVVKKSHQDNIMATPGQDD